MQLLIYCSANALQIQSCGPGADPALVVLTISPESATSDIPLPARVEQPMRPKMHVLSGALAAQPHYPLLVLNNYSADSNKLTGHRKHA